MDLGLKQAFEKWQEIFCSNFCLKKRKEGSPNERFEDLTEEKHPTKKGTAKFL